MNRPQRKAFSPLLRQLTAGIVAISFSLNAMAADLVAKVGGPTPPAAPDAVKAAPEATKAAPAGGSESDGEGITSNKKGDRLDPERPEGSSAQAESLCEGKNSPQDDDNAVKKWQAELERVSSLHKSLGMQEKRKFFLDGAITPLTNVTGINRDKQKRGICEFYRGMARETAALNAKIASSPPGGEVCEEPARLYGIYKAQYQALEQYKARIKLYLEGGEFEVPQSNGSWKKERYTGLADRFVLGISTDDQQIRRQFPAKATIESLTPADRQKVDGLLREYREVWGKRNPPKTKQEILNMTDDGMFVHILKLYQAEGTRVSKVQHQLEEAAKALEAKDPSCMARIKNGEGADLVKPNGRPAAGPTPRPYSHKPEPSISGSGDPVPQTDEEKISELKEKCPGLGNDSANQAQCYSDLRAAEKRVADNKKRIEGYTSNSDPYNSPGPPKASPQEQAVQPLRGAGQNQSNVSTPASDFLSENAGLLVGGTLVVGGGVGLYYWDKHEKKKRQDEWEAYWNNIQAIASASSTSTSTSTATSRRLAVQSSVGNTAVAGLNLPGIQVAIVDAGGTTLTGQDVDITLSCTTPIPCYLSGTTVVRSVNGVATFSDVRFTQAVSGVRLRFSTAWGGVDQGNSIQVLSATSTTTVTSTNTNTNTNTSTNTNTNTSTSTNTNTSTNTSTSTGTRM